MVKYFVQLTKVDYNDKIKNWTKVSPYTKRPMFIRIKSKAQINVI